MNDNPFQILNNDAKGSPLEDTFAGEELMTRLEKLTKAHKVMLFMKGTPAEPMCGFSANTVAILKHVGSDFKTFDILSDEHVRQGLKTFSNWPTFPQLYVDGELLGGNDIITEMYQSGELQKMLEA